MVNQINYTCVKQYFLILFIPYREHIVSVNKINSEITCMKYSLGMRSFNNCHQKLVCGLAHKFFFLSTTSLHVLTRS